MNPRIQELSKDVKKNANVDEYQDEYQDLSLLVFDGKDHRDNYYSKTVLTMKHVSREMFKNLEQKEIPDGFKSYLSNRRNEYHPEYYGCFAETRFSRDGTILRYITVEQFLSLKNNEDLSIVQVNKAILVYLSCLDKNTRIALYWN